MDAKNQKLKAVLDEVQERVRGPLEHAQAERSASTIKTYKLIYARTAEKEDPLVDIPGRSWKVFRAALKYQHAMMIRNIYATLVRIYDQGYAGKEGENVEAKLTRLVEMLAASLDMYDQVDKAEKPAGLAEKQTMKHRLPSGEHDWRADAFRLASAPSRMAVALLWASGVRPAELQRGVSIRKVGRSVFVRIEGAKCSELTGAGQPYRILEIDATMPAGKAVVSCMTDDEMDYSRNRKTLDKDLEILGWKMGWDQRLNAYTFRHAGSSDLKADGDKERTALSLGHKAVKSQSAYGSSQQGQSKRSPIISVEAARPLTWTSGDGPRPRA